MNYQRIMQKIMEQLAVYKSEVDEVAVAYSTEKAKYERELKDMKGKYTPEYIEESRRNWKPKVNYRGIIDLARETHQKVATDYLDKVKNELDRYFQIPVDSGFAATVTAVKSLGVTLNNREFELLQGASGGYWGLRLLNELGVSRTKTEQRAELEDGQTKRVEKEVKTPYTTVNLPDIEAAYNSLQSVKNAINIAFEGYCGEGYALKDIVFPPSRYTEETNAKLAAEYDIEPPKPTMDTMQITKMANATGCFNESHTAYTEFSDMMSALMATMPKPKRKETLTDDDKKLIDTIIDSKYESLAKDQAVQIAKADEHLAEILRLDTRYSREVRTALGEVSENE